MAENSSSEDLSNLGKRSSSLSGLNQILNDNDDDSNDAQSSQDTSSNNDNIVADSFIKNINDITGSQSSSSDSNTLSDSSNDSGSANSESQDGNNSEKSSALSSELSASQSKDVTEGSSSSVDPQLQQELTGDAEEQISMHISNEAKAKSAKEASESQAQPDVDKSSSSSTDDNDKNTQPADNNKDKKNKMRKPTPNIIKQIPLKDFHSFDVGLQRAYVNHKQMVKDIKQLHQHINNHKSTDQDFIKLIKDDTKVFQNICDTIYTNRKNYDRHVDEVDKMLQDTKDKASKGADEILKWKEEGLFSDIMPYLETIADTVSDPRFKQIEAKMDTKDLTPTSKLTKISSHAQEVGKRLNAEQAKQAGNNNK